MGNRTHNGRLLRMIEQATATAEKSTSKEGLLKAVQIVRAFKGPLEFDQTKPKAAAIVLGALALAAIAFAIWGSPEMKAWVAQATGVDHQLVQIGLAVFFGTSTLACFAFMGSRECAAKPFGGYRPAILSHHGRTGSSPNG